MKFGLKLTAFLRSSSGFKQHDKLAPNSSAGILFSASAK